MHIFLQVHFPELAFIRFTVTDTRGNENVSVQRVIPLNKLLTGQLGNDRI